MVDLVDCTLRRPLQYHTQDMFFSSHYWAAQSQRDVCAMSFLLMRKLSI